MKKENMLTYLEQQLEKKLGNYDFAIDWHTKSHTVEVIVVLYAQNQAEQAIEDTVGTQTEEEVIEFEDSLLLFDPSKSTPPTDDYLAILPFEGKKGLPKQTITAIATYLNDVLTEGESDLMDFLADDEAEIFELNWQAEAFEKILATTKESTDYVAYPKY